MATTLSLLRSNVVSATLRRYGMSLGHGILVFVAATLVFVTPGARGSVNIILWGLLASEACLIAFWMVLSAQTAAARGVYGLLHLLGLTWCVMAAGKLHLDLHWSPYGTAENLRDVPVVFLASALTAALLRARGWRLNDLIAGRAERSDIARNRVQYSLDDFGKWFTLLCIVLGLSVSLLPDTVFWERFAWQLSSWHYLAFVVAVLLPIASAASLFLGLALAGRAIRLREGWRALALWGSMTAVLLLGTAVSVGIRTPYDIYLRHEPLMLPALAAWIIIIAFTAYSSGWRVARNWRAT